MNVSDPLKRWFYITLFGADVLLFQHFLILAADPLGHNDWWLWWLWGGGVVVWSLCLARAFWLLYWENPRFRLPELEVPAAAHNTWWNAVARASLWVVLGLLSIIGWLCYQLSPSQFTFWCWCLNLYLLALTTFQLVWDSLLWWKSSCLLSLGTRRLKALSALHDFVHRRHQSEVVGADQAGADGSDGSDGWGSGVVIVEITDPTPPR